MSFKELPWWVGALQHQTTSWRRDDEHNENAGPRGGQIIAVDFFNSGGRKTTIFATGDEARVEVEYLVPERVNDALNEIYFYSMLVAFTHIFRLKWTETN